MFGRSAFKPSECENVTKESHKSNHIGKEGGGICKMQDVQTRDDVCRSMVLSPSTVSTIMKNAYKIKQSVQHATTVSAMQVSYRRSQL
jgi:hypothetical protein